MSDEHISSKRRRDFLDGSYTVGLLTVAILSGYLLLSPAVETARATTVARPVPVPTPGPVSDYVGRPIERAPEPPKVTWPKTISGQILDANRSPFEGVSVVIGGVEHLTNAEGRFTIEGHPADAPMVVMQPQMIKAAYLTYFGIGDRGIRGRVLDLAARTELNAVVIDVKGDRGWIVYKTEVPQALAVGAQGPGTLKNFDDLMADLKSRGIYTIARIVTFKDNILATGRPDLAITDTRTGKPWIDRENLAWVDPLREEVWKYNVAIAREAASKGFDEIQFDYVRFPTDGKLGAAKYSGPVNKDTRLPAIAGFLGRARRELGPLGVYVAADVFGYTAFNDNDTDIGQRIEELAPHLDYFCPMVYPSGYHVGIPGYRNPVQHPYEIVHESVRLIRQRSATQKVRVRPWLQDFKDYAFDKRIFGVTEIRAQIKGADDAGAVGWMLWNPRNDYTAGALRQKEASGTK